MGCGWVCWTRGPSSPSSTPRCPRRQGFQNTAAGNLQVLLQAEKRTCAVVRCGYDLARTFASYHGRYQCVKGWVGGWMLVLCRRCDEMLPRPVCRKETTPIGPVPSMCQSPPGRDERDERDETCGCGRDEEEKKIRQQQQGQGPAVAARAIRPKARELRASLW